MSHSGSYVWLQTYRMGEKKAFARSSVEQDLRYMVEHEPNINQHCHAVVKKGKCHIGMYKQEYSLHDP